MRFVLDCVYILAAVAISPVFLYRLLRQGRYRAGWAQRFGHVTRLDPRKKCIWLHAVSVGEVNAAKTLIAELEARYTDAEIVVSSTTDTGFARATKLFGGRRQVFYFPFDLSWVMRRAFGHIGPSLCLLMELEVWPNFISTARRNRVPVVVVNGRISDRSFAQYRRIRWLTQTFFSKIDLVLAQTAEYAQRFEELGCPAERVVVTGSLKYDTAQITDRVEGVETLAEQLNLVGARLWVAGGTGNDEEKIILGAYRSLVREPAFADMRLAVVPRKPERFDEVAGLIGEMGLPLIRYSELKGTSDRAAADERAVILGDTMGDLRKFYSLATIIFVGRSLVRMGGSDMMEAAALGKCTLFGPHAFNFRQTVEALLADKGALLVEDERGLLATLKRCLGDTDYARAVAERGRDVIRKNQGATALAIRYILDILPPTNANPSAGSPAPQIATR